jgi:hypothetical protein
MTAPRWNAMEGGWFVTVALEGGMRATVGPFRGQSEGAGAGDAARAGAMEPGSGCLPAISQRRYWPCSRKSIGKARGAIR